MNEEGDTLKIHILYQLFLLIHFIFSLLLILAVKFFFSLTSIIAPTRVASIIAPTKVASINVVGTTIHIALQIALDYFWKKCPSLNDKMRSMLRSLKK